MTSLERRKQKFLSSVREIHGNDYCYDKVVYKCMHTKVEILCNTCLTPFSQSPSSHKSGSGCPPCGHIKIGKSQRLTTEDFISKATAKHGGFYSYPNAEYGKTNRDHVLVLCPLHGEFPIPPMSHLFGRGCRQCGFAVISKAKRKSQEGFISDSMRVHPDKYTYEKVEYRGSTVKVSITCKIHGDFEQIPSNHLEGSEGCRGCAKYGFGVLNEATIERDKDKLSQSPCGVYLFSLPDLGSDVYKIGITKDVHGRTRDFKSKAKVVVVDCLGYYDTNRYQALLLEKYLHDLFISHRFVPDEKFDGHTEMFNLTKDMVTFTTAFLGEAIQHK